MANDVSKFRVQGDPTIYSFNDEDAEEKVAEKADAVTHRLATYTDVTQLGLTYGSATITGAWQALSQGSMLVTDQRAFADTQPPGAGYVVIIKGGVDTARSGIFRYGAYSTHDDWRMFLTSATSPASPSGTWVSMLHDLVTTTMTVEQESVAAGSNTGVKNITIPAENRPATSGWSAVGVIGYSASGSGSSGFNFARLYASGTTLTYVARNNNTSSATAPTLEFTILWKRTM